MVTQIGAGLGLASRPFDVELILEGLGIARRGVGREHQECADRVLHRFAASRVKGWAFAGFGVAEPSQVLANFHRCVLVAGRV